MLAFHLFSLFLCFSVILLVGNNLNGEVSSLLDYMICLMSSIHFTSNDLFFVYPCRELRVVWGLALVCFWHIQRESIQWCRFVYLLEVKFYTIRVHLGLWWFIFMLSFKAIEKRIAVFSQVPPEHGELIQVLRWDSSYLCIKSILTLVGRVLFSL